MTEKYMEELLASSELTYEPYSLVNNHGYHITYKGTHYDLRHWLNVYGVNTNFWDLSAQGKKRKNIKHGITLEELIKTMEEE